VFLEADSWPTAGLQGRVVGEWVDPNPRLKINQITNFSCMQMFFMFCIFWDYLKSKQKAKQDTEILIAKLQNSNQNFAYAGLG